MYKEIQLSAIVRKGNPRSYFDEDTINELAESIKAQGVLQAILVRPLPGKKFHLVFGERRYRASILAGKETIPAQIRELSDEEVLEIQLTENFHRDNVNPLDEAIGFSIMEERKNFTIEEMAARVGKTPGFVRSRLVLNHLVEEAKQLLYKGILPVTHATKIAALQPKKQKEALNKVIVYNTEKVAIAHKPIQHLNDWLKSNLIRQLDEAAFDITDSELVDGVPSCLDCSKCTINAASLFPEDATNRGCLDPTCYAQKVIAHVANKTEEIKRKNKNLDPIKVSDVYYSQDDSILNATKYQVRAAGEKCSSCQLGVIAHSDKGQEGKEVWVCQHALCPTYQDAHNKFQSPEAAKQDVIVSHAERLVKEINMEQLYDQEFDSKMMLHIEYFSKWMAIPSSRQQEIIDTLSWEYDTSDDKGYDEGVLTDIQICPEDGMFMQNFHGKERERETIDKEYRMELLIQLANNQDSEIKQEIVKDSFEPVYKQLYKANIKTAKKLAEFYDNPTQKGLKKITPENLIRLFRTMNALQTLAKRFGIVYNTNHVTTLDLAKEIINNA